MNSIDHVSNCMHTQLSQDYPSMSVKEIHLVFKTFQEKKYVNKLCHLFMPGNHNSFEYHMGTYTLETKLTLEFDAYFLSLMKQAYPLKSIAFPAHH